MAEAKTKKTVKKDELRYLPDSFGSGKAAHLECAEMDYRGWKIELVPVERKLTSCGYSVVYNGYARNEYGRVYAVNSGFSSYIIPEIKAFIREKIREFKERFEWEEAELRQRLNAGDERAE